VAQRELRRAVALRRRVAVVVEHVGAAAGPAADAPERVVAVGRPGRRARRRDPRRVRRGGGRRRPRRRRGPRARRGEERAARADEPVAVLDEARAQVQEPARRRVPERLQRRHAPARRREPLARVRPEHALGGGAPDGLVRGPLVEAQRRVAVLRHAVAVDVARAERHVRQRVAARRREVEVEHGRVLARRAAPRGGGGGGGGGAAHLRRVGPQRRALGVVADDERVAPERDGDAELGRGVAPLGRRAEAPEGLGQVARAEAAHVAGGRAEARPRAAALEEPRELERAVARAGARAPVGRERVHLDRAPQRPRAVALPRPPARSLAQEALGLGLGEGRVVGGGAADEGEERESCAHPCARPDRA